MLQMANEANKLSAHLQSTFWVYSENCRWCRWQVAARVVRPCSRIVDLVGSADLIKWGSFVCISLKAAFVFVSNQYFYLFVLVEGVTGSSDSVVTYYYNFCGFQLYTAPPRGSHPPQLTTPPTKQHADVKPTSPRAGLPPIASCICLLFTAINFLKILLLLPRPPARPSISCVSFHYQQRLHRSVLEFHSKRTVWLNIPFKVESQYL